MPLVMEIRILHARLRIDTCDGRRGIRLVQGPGRYAELWIVIREYTLDSFVP